RRAGASPRAGSARRPQARLRRRVSPRAPRASGPLREGLMAARPPSPVRVHAAEIVREVVRRGAEVPPLLAARERDLAAPDRDLLREIVFGVLRNRSALDAELASV